MTTKEHQLDERKQMQFGASEDEKAAALQYMLGNYDWQYAARSDVLGDDIGDFPMNQVAEVLAFADGANDEACWIAAFRMVDGQFAFLMAGCDYTGWDCQSGGTVQYAATVDGLIRMCMTLDERERLGCLLEDDADLRGSR